MESDVTQSAAFYKTWAWAETHKKHIAYGAIALVLVGIVIGFVVWQKNEKQNAASYAMSKIASQGSMTGRPAEPEAFVKIAAEFPNTGGAERASLIAGARFFAEQKYAEAQTQFQKFVNDFPNSDFAGQAALGIAASLEAQNKIADAMKAYKEIAERRSTESVAAPARLGLARLLEAQGNLAQARETYEQAARPEFGVFGQEAGMFLQELIMQNPALLEQPAVTNALNAPSNAPVLKLN